MKGLLFRFILISSILSGTVFISGCSLFEDNHGRGIRPMYPVSVSIEQTGSPDHLITFTIESNLNDGCSLYSHATTIRDGYDVYIGLFQKRDSQLYCTDAIVRTTVICNYNPPAGGDYKFHFWRSDSTSLDTVVMVR